MDKIVLGGGLSGLSAAYYLTKKFPNESIKLIESSQRTGGWIRSSRQANGTIFEQGPRTIRPKGESGANTLQLVEELGLSAQVVPIISSHPAAKNRMIYANKSLHLLPSSLSGLFKKQKPFSKPLIFHLMNDLTAERKIVNDESIYDFIERRFSKEVADYLISPLICGICAGNAQEISVNFLMKELFKYEQQYGSISKGFFKNMNTNSKKKPLSSTLALRAKQEKWNIYSFTNGCEVLPLALRDNILEKNATINLNTCCSLVKIGKNLVTLYLNNGEIITCNHLIAATASNKFGELLGSEHSELSHYLKTLIKNVSVGVVNLSFKDQLIENSAFGLLVAPKENLPILGIIYDSCCFPNENVGTTLTVMMGGYWFEQHFGKNPSESTLLKIALGQVKNILNVTEKPSIYKVNILHNCIPQYIVGHNDTINKINSYIRTNNLPISLCGSSYYGVGINDVILSAKNAVEQLR